MAKAAPRTRWRPHDGQIPMGRLRITVQDGLYRPGRKTNRVPKIERVAHARQRHRLIDEAGYSKFDMGVMIKFKEGLQPSLLREILLHNVPAPKTLVDWKQKARERQTVYKELKNAGLHRGATDLQKKWAQKLGLKTYQTPYQRSGQSYRPPHVPTRSQVVPMDVDAGTMEGSSQGKPPPYQGRGG